MNIAILGAGNVGRHLHQLFGTGNHSVWLCSRKATAELLSFEDGIAHADVVCLALPFTALSEALRPLAAALIGKVVVDCTNPLNADWSPLLLGEENSAGEEVVRLLPQSRVVKAFNTIFADVMASTRQVRSGLRITAFVASDDVEAKRAVLQLAADAGFAPLDVGSIRMARYLEAMAHLNIQIAVSMAGGTDAAFLYHQSTPLNS